MQPIRLYFSSFSVNQLMSPIIGEFKSARDKLVFFHRQILSKLPKNARVPSKKLPVGIYIKFFTVKDHYQIENFSLIAYELVKVLTHATIIQDSNLACVYGVAYDVEITDNPDKEGCEIVFISQK